MLAVHCNGYIPISLKFLVDSATIILISYTILYRQTLLMYLKSPKELLFNYYFFIALLFSLNNYADTSEISQDLRDFDSNQFVFKDGFVPLYLNTSEGRVLLVIDQFDQDFLYLGALASGVGSNDIGLDRGQLGSTRLVNFRKNGNKVFLIQKNISFRASSNNIDETKSVQDAFAESILWGFEILHDNDDGVIIDATDFFLEDAHGVARRLSKTNQGQFKVDHSRSGLNFSMIKNFPKNTEVEAIITLKGEATGDFIKSVVPTPDAVTVRQRHSFVKLPDDEYIPRVFDSRAGFSGVSFMDFAAPIDRPIMKRFIARHRLLKKDPDAEMSEPIDPIIYYLDRGTPEPVRSALLDGGNWWNQAFEAAGFKNAFRVELAPKDMDFLDVRYNVIQWVHRSTRGWSYGASVRDPRTGEILKGHVSLGSLRVRQDYLIAQGLLQPFEKDQPLDEKMLEMALARLRQLSAHEIGHTLGLSHNFSSSAAGRSSVMDYPYPLITGNSDKLDFSNAYDDKIGAWDKWAITYGYGYPRDGQDEAVFLNHTLEKTYDEGYEFISDSDARDVSGIHPRAHLWDNGNSASVELVRLLELRKARMQTFNLNAIPTGVPESMLEEIFVPLYLMHRYQLEATAKLIGGVNFSYKIKGDNQPRHGWIEPNIQKKALHALILAISADQLKVPSHVIELIPPKPFGYNRSRETFESRLGPIFDPIAPAENIVDLVFRLLLESGRANRIHIQHLQNPNLLSFKNMLNLVQTSIFSVSVSSGIEEELQIMVGSKWVDHLMMLAKNPSAAESVRAIIRAHLKLLQDTLSGNNFEKGINTTLALETSIYIREKIKSFFDNPIEFDQQRIMKVPDGSPIGVGTMSCQFDY